MALHGENPDTSKEDIVENKREVKGNYIEDSRHKNFKIKIAFRDMSSAKIGYDNNTKGLYM